MRLFRILVLVASLICLSPAAVLTAVAITAGILGCRVHEGFKEPCLAGGTDIGGTLYAFGMSGWLLIATLPILAGVLVMWAVVEVARVARGRLG